MRQSTKENLRITVLLVLILSGLIGIAIFIGVAGSNKFDYDLHHQSAASAPKWSNGTLDDAKRVVTYIMSHTTEAGELKISGDNLRVWEPDKHWAFDDNDIVFNDCFMLLSKQDYLAYVKWLKKISKPYVKGDIPLTPPYMPPPWEGLSN